jgi:hypothetical protein
MQFLFERIRDPGVVLGEGGTVLKPSAVAVLGTFLACGVASAQWSFSGWEPSKCDLVVVGTLSQFEGSLSLAHGELYEEALGTIAVERVLYAKEGAEVPSQIQLHSGQNVGLLCARVAHSAHVNERGTWLLERSEVNGVYTAYRPNPLLIERPKPETPRVRVVEAELDTKLGLLRVGVRYENFGPEAVTFPADHLVVERVGGDANESTSRRPGPWRSEVSVSPGRYKEATFHFPFPQGLANDDVLVVRPSTNESEAHHGRRVELRRRGESAGTGAPLWLPPNAKADTRLGYPSAPLLLLGALVGLLPLIARGASWRWRPWSLKLGTLLATSTLTLFPWAVLGLFAPMQVLAGFGPSLLGAIVFHLLVVRLLRRSARAYRPAIALGSLAPPLYLASCYGLLFACAQLGTA